MKENGLLAENWDELKKIVNMMSTNEAISEWWEAEDRAQFVRKLKEKNIKTFAAHREEWALGTCFVYPGPIQYFGPTEVCDQCTMTLKLEQEKK